MIRDILSRFGSKRILVLGDVMLDHYVWGKVERISPEAPVPVLEAQQEEYRLGGAANVALNARTLGAEVILVGMVGQDSAAQQLRQLLEDNGISSRHLLVSDDRSTTLKTRIGSVNQQIIRIDYESKNEIGDSLADKLLAELHRIIPTCDAVIIEDYNKGLLTEKVIAGALAATREHSVPIAVDPKARNFLSYVSAEIFKPNYKELQAVLGRSFDSDEDFYTAANELCNSMQLRHLIVTRGSKGLYIFAGDNAPTHLPTYAREVFDVSGAGDTVICALTLAYICGADILQAAEIANHAAGVVCGIKGTASVSVQDLLASYDER